MAKNTVDVYVKLPSGRVSQFDMTAYQTISNICQRVAQEERVEVQQVRLKYQGKVLKLGDTISYLGIRAETILKAEILESRPLTLLLLREGVEGEGEELLMRSLDTLVSLRNRVADLLGCSPGKVSMTVWSRELKGTTIQDAGLSDGSKINVSVRTEPEVTSKAKADESPAKVNAEEEDKPVDPEKLQSLISSFDAGGKRVEVAFSFDTTGSMSQYLSTVRRKLRECCTRLLQDIPNIRISLIAHGDYCDQNTYVTSCVGLTSDAQALVTFADTVKDTSGGDSPECYEWVLREAQQLDWGEDSAKALVIIGDAEPHYVSYTDQALDWNTELDVLVGMGIKVYGVQPKKTYPAAHFYEALAERSGGCYLNLSDMDAITDMFLAARLMGDSWRSWRQSWRRRVACLRAPSRCSKNWGRARLLTPAPPLTLTRPKTKASPMLPRLSLAGGSSGGTPPTTLAPALSSPTTPTLASGLGSIIRLASRFRPNLPGVPQLQNMCQPINPRRSPRAASSCKRLMRHLHCHGGTWPSYGSSAFRYN